MAPQRKQVPVISVVPLLFVQQLFQRPNLGGPLVGIACAQHAVEPPDVRLLPDQPPVHRDRAVGLGEQTGEDLHRQDRVIKATPADLSAAEAPCRRTQTPGLPALVIQVVIVERRLALVVPL